MSYGTEHECVIVVLFGIILLKFQRKKVERRAPFRVHQGALFAILHLYLQVQICYVCWQVISSTGITLHRGINSAVDEANECTDVTHHRIMKYFSSFFLCYEPYTDISCKPCRSWWGLYCVICQFFVWCPIFKKSDIWLNLCKKNYDALV